MAAAQDQSEGGGAKQDEEEKTEKLDEREVAEKDPRSL